MTGGESGMTGEIGDDCAAIVCLNLMSTRVNRRPKAEGAKRRSET